MKFVIVCFFLWAETPIFVVCSEESMFKDTQKMALFLNTPVLTAPIKISFFAFFILGVFGISNLSRDVFDR